ncbi:armadillo repeat-containing protein 3 [Alosa sapidissima]|uniref:armadillo repeat-containing protein 3 n=1 Tax=Alosa sapidissima TaxID=34773 RepID=UPI001C08B155|nr:armadillo repeat-containing protein 3 [Alosa sapidissima]
MGKKAKKEPEPPTKDEFDPLSIESRRADTAVLMLSSPEEGVLAKACEAIRKFAEKGDENRITLMGLGAVEPLSHLISHDDKSVRKNAFMALGIMAHNGDVKKMLKKLDVIPSIIARLSPEEDVVIHEFATQCLASLALDFACKVQIFDSEALGPLIHLLSSSDPDVVKNSVECIYNLVQDLPSRVAVRELNGIPQLLGQLHSEFPVIQELTLRTLGHITTDKETRLAFREEQGLEKLLEVLTKKEYNDLHVEALQVVSNCLEDVDTLQYVRERAGLQTLLTFVTTPTLPEVQSNAVKAITKVAQSYENRKILHEQDVEKSLMALLAVENNRVRSATCQAVAVMSKHLASKDTFRHLGSIKPIVQLLSSESTEVRESAAHALSSLTSGNQLNAQAVFEAEGDEALVQQVQDGGAREVAYAASVLTNMAAQEALRRNILSQGVMQTLVGPLQFKDTHLLVSIIQAVATLASDAEGRTEFRTAGGLPHLVKLLHSYNTEVRRNACWALSVCANDESAASELSKLGALEVLQEINSSTNRRNRFSDIALQRLLDNNLSAKYSLTGHLSATDVIADGFYDPGQTRAGQKVPDLVDLSNQVISQRRPVIAVNGKPQDLSIHGLAEARQPDSACESRAASAQSNRSNSRAPSKAKQRDEDVSKPQQRHGDERQGLLPWDSQLCSLITEATKSILPLEEERDQLRALAVLVSNAMGGALSAEQQHDFLWELHLSELKHEEQSNIIPIGKIKKGTYIHRALLYKVLADRIGVGCSLVRGDYNRAWNEVLITEGPPKTPGCYCQPCVYVVDLIHSPGELMKSNSPAAIKYQRI